ncbi:MAG: hypothetical protein Q4D29_01215 [Lachnospiraceae bacterium]|nr:hypothetical protein [Lachnospiraceae bacterium]
MRIVEDEYNWKRADPTVITLTETPTSIEFDTPLKIYRFRGEGEFSIFADEEMSELIYSGIFPFEPEIPICCTGLTFVAGIVESGDEEEESEDGENDQSDDNTSEPDSDTETEEVEDDMQDNEEDEKAPVPKEPIEPTAITLVSETGIQKTVLDDYLNTTEGMSYISNGYNDDGTYSTAGLPEFIFNGVAASTIYISSNHWIGFGVNTSQLYILQRDGCSTAIWRQEGTCGNGVKFLKIRFEGYTVYSQRVDSNRLIFELFIMSNKDMFLNVIQTPTSGNTGTSQMVCNNQTTMLSLADPTGAGGGTMVSFYHLDEEGKTWNIVYDNYKGIDYFSYGFLLKADGMYCTVVDGVLKELMEEVPTAADFYEFGFLEVPASEIMVGIDNPQILYWRAGGDTELIKDVVKAYPYPHTIKCEIDMSHISILGIMMMTAQYSGDVRVKYSLDNEETYSDEISMDEWLNTDVVELWNSLPENKKLFLLFVLHDNATISRFKITYEN